MKRTKFGNRYMLLLSYHLRFVKISLGHRVVSLMQGTYWNSQNFGILTPTKTWAQCQSRCCSQNRTRTQLHPLFGPSHKICSIFVFLYTSIISFFNLTFYHFQSLIYGKRLLRSQDRAALYEANKKECEQLIERWQSEDCMNAISKFFSGKHSKLWMRDESHLSEMYWR